MENPELLLIELEKFNRTSEQEDNIPTNLENYIEYVSKTGTYIFPWMIIQKLYLKKLSNVLNNLQSTMALSFSPSGNENLNNSSSLMQTSLNDTSTSSQLIIERITERMKSFTSAPFTIQRISELLLKPNNHYNRIEKFLRGLEKCIMVVTTIDPNGNKIFIEYVPLTNGTSSSPPSPINITTPTRPISPFLKQESNSECADMTSKFENSNTSIQISQTTISSIDELSVTPEQIIVDTDTVELNIKTSTIVSNEEEILLKTENSIEN